MASSTTNALPRGPLLIAAASWLLLFGAFALPAIPLDTPFAEATVYVAESGSRWGFPAVATLVVLLLVTRQGLTTQRRLTEMLVLGGAMALLFGVGDIANELLIKPVLGKPRPFITELDGDGTLGTSLEVFYGGWNATERAEHLKSVLENPYFTGVKLAAPVRNHWIRTVGYSLPSGHTLAAFALLSFALIATKALAGPLRFGLACLLVPWAMAVSYSRVLLRVHWPYDIVSSGMAGILIGLAFYSIMYRLLWSQSPEIPADSPPRTAQD